MIRLDNEIKYKIGIFIRFSLGEDLYFNVYMLSYIHNNNIMVNNKISMNAIRSIIDDRITTQHQRFW